MNIKQIIANYFAQKAITEANKVWDNNKWTDIDAEKMLNKHERTKYQRK